MKNLFKVLIVPLLIGIAVGTYNFLINRQSVDVRYTLSENIPININNQLSYQNVQQLVVKNLGNSKAEKIIVNIQGKITSYDLIKYSESDKEQSYNKADTIQIIYPELPPQGDFSIIIKSEGKGITIKDVLISHNKGEATEALSSENSKSVWNSVLICVLYLMAFIYMIRSVLIDTLHRKSKYSEGYKEILSRKSSPFYISETKWNEIRKDALEAMKNDSGEMYAFKGVENCNCYKVLSKERPDYLKDSEWEEVLKRYIEKLEEGIGSIVTRIFCNINDLIKILKLEKPQHVNLDKWEEIRKKILQKMQRSIQEDCSDVFSKEIEEYEAYKLLNGNKPDYLSENEWSVLSSEMVKVLESAIINNFTTNLVYTNNISKYLEIRRPQFFSVNKWDEVINHICEKYIITKKYKLINGRYFLYNDELKKELNDKKVHKFPEEKWDDYIEFIKELYHFNVLYNLYRAEKPLEFLSGQQIEFLDDFRYLEDVAYSVQLVNYYKKSFEKDYNQFISSERPNWINEGAYNVLARYLEEKFKLNGLIDKNEEIRKMQEEKDKELMTEINCVKELKDKITCQLTIINSLLSDPTSIERIEDYNNVFAKGNFENLVKISKLMSDN